MLFNIGRNICRSLEQVTA